jgi:hypothetical protein
MANVIALFEGPDWSDGIEQIAQRTAGRWFRRTIDARTGRGCVKRLDCLRIA